MHSSIKYTSPVVASIAGKILKNRQYSPEVKSIAGSALAQAKPKGK